MALNAIRSIAAVFLPDDDSWRRHANPWSVWSRFATLPFVVLAVWSRAWIGWVCLLPIAVLIVWVWLNPRLFGPPARFDSWGARAVLGEQIYVAGVSPALRAHTVALRILTTLQSLGGLVLAYGVWQLDLMLTVFGMTVVYLAKMWFLDRMVWLHDDATRTGG